MLIELPHITEILHQPMLLRVIGWVPKLLSCYLCGQILLWCKVIGIIVWVDVIFAIAQLLHQLSRGIP